MKKERGGEAEPGTVKRVGILGGGLMGGGIASVTAINAGLPVRIKDISLEGVNHALKTSWELLSKRLNGASSLRHSISSRWHVSRAASIIRASHSAT